MRYSETGPHGGRIFLLVYNAFMIIGVVGTTNSGKDTVAKYLIEKTGWPTFSFSDQLREMSKERGGDTENSTLNALAIELRNQHGLDYIARLGLSKFKGQNLIVTSIRNPAEPQPFRDADDFVLIAIDAPVEMRWKRAIERARGKEGNMTLAQFQEQEKITRQGSSSGQRIDDVMGTADYIIQNDGTLEQLHQKLDTVLAEII